MNKRILNLVPLDLDGITTLIANITNSGQMFNVITSILPTSNVPQ